MTKAERWLEEYQEYQKRIEGDQEKKNYLWRPPVSTDFKVNVDAACFDGEGSGFRMVIRDREGKFCLASVKRSRVQWTPEMEECLAIRWGIDLAVEHGFGQCEIETDCLGVVHKLRSEGKVMTEEGVLCEELHDHLRDLGSIKVDFSGRNSNKSAHLMAHSTCEWERSRSVGYKPTIFSDGSAFNRFL
ncbi:unnamed protein product [Linum trigynum]|uniref:RNase H type-1 domain-containing protein n=1 Tax=Linum trigynum TaxID=586398 RepID=A0AAV2CHZ6_9ROSI